MDYCENEHNCPRQELFKDFDDYTSLTLPKSACKCVVFVIKDVM